MGNLFDHMQADTFRVVTKTFGYPATWQPANGQPQKTAQVTYKAPSAPEELGTFEYNPNTYISEYWHTDFEGLKTAVDLGQTVERLIIDGVPHIVRAVYADRDGKNMRAVLELEQ